MRRLSLLCLVLSLVFASMPAHAQLQIKDCIKAGRLSEEAQDFISTNPGYAVKKLQEAIALCDTSASMHFNLAMAYYNAGDTTEAEASLEQSLRIKDDNAKVMNALAYLLITKPNGDYKRAEKLAKKAVELAPGSRAYANTLEMIREGVDIPVKTRARKPDAIAVVIGNVNYKNPVLPPVKYANNDAAIMRKYLVEALGFSEQNIFFVKDASNNDFIKYFGSETDHKGILYQRIKEGRSDVFIYYSGHGAPDTNTKKAYLVPFDADPTMLKLTGYSLDTLYGNLAKLNIELKPKSVTVVLDACFSGGSNDGMIIQNASPIYVETTIPLLVMKNAAVLSSSRGNQISSWYPEKNHGLFTYFLLKTMKASIEKGKKMTMADIERAMNGENGVNDLAWKLYNRNQEPQLMGDRSVAFVE